MSIPKDYQSNALRAYKPPRLVTGKVSWCISFYAFDPVLGKLRKKTYKLNHIKPVSTRRIYANEYIKRLNTKLIEGWNPWIESDNSNAYREFSDVLGAYRRHLSRQLDSDIIRPDSYRAYISYLRIIETYNEEKGKIKYIYQFDQSFVNKFLDYIFIDRKNSARTRNNYFAFLRLVSTWLVEKQYIKSKPTDGISAFRRAGTKKNRTVISSDDLAKIGDYFRKNDVHMLLACYVLHTCFIRPKEMSMLKIERVNFEKSTILVPGEISKNRKDETVTISDDLKDLFLELKTDQFPGSHYLFSDELKPGKKYRASKQFTDRWNKMKKALKLPKEYQFYSLKDTGITNLFYSGVDSISIRNQARHYNIAITDTYTPKDIHEANEKIKTNSRGF